MKEDKKQPILIVERIHPDAKLPTRAYEMDAGLDLYAVEDQKLYLLKPTLIPIGIRVVCPDGHYLRVSEKSGLSMKGIKIGGGVIDIDYTGELGVVMTYINAYQKFISGTAFNSVFDHGSFYEVKKGQKVAQLICEKISFPKVVEGKVNTDATRGEKGFGSTGNA